MKNTFIAYFIVSMALLGITLFQANSLDALQNVVENHINNPRHPNGESAALIEALRFVYESELKGTYLNFVIEYLFTHMNNLPTMEQIRDLVTVLTEMQERGHGELSETAEFIKNFNNGNPPKPPGPSGMGSGLSKSVGNLPFTKG